MIQFNGTAGVRRMRHGMTLGLCVLALSACGGGDSGTPAQYTVGATVSGLSGTGLILQDNGGDDLSVAASGAVTFAKSVASGAAYGVTVLTQPSTQTCTVANGTGTIGTSNVTNVTVTCTTPTVVAGQVVDDFVAGATVNAYQITATGTQGALVAGPVTTNSSGLYQLTLPASFTGGALLITSTGGTYTDSATGQVVNLATSMLTLSAILPSVTSNTINTAAVTPLTTMAATLALASIGANGTAPAAAAAAANTAVMNYFGQGNLLTTVLVDLTQPNCAASAKQVSSDASLILAGLAALAHQYGVSTEALIQALIQDLSDGVLNGAVNGTPITVPSLTAGSAAVALATIEGSAAGAFPGLAAAIANFQASSNNKCAQTLSASIAAALTNPTNTQLGDIGLPVALVGRYSGPSIAAESAATVLTATFTYTGGSGSPSTVSYPLPIIPASTTCTTNCPFNFIYSLPTTPSKFLSWSVSTTPQFSPVKGLTCTPSAGEGATITQPTSYSFSGPFSIGLPTPLVCQVPATFTVGGTVAHYTGSGLVLEDNGGDRLTVPTGATSFTFATAVAAGGAYDVTVATQPTDGETCTVSNATGTVGANVTGVAIACTPAVTATPLAAPEGLAFLNGDLYVANSGSNSILVFTVQYDAAHAVTGLTQVGSISQGLNSPARVAFDGNGKLYVANLVNASGASPGAITVYDTKNGNQQIVADTVTAHDRPLAVAVDGSGNLYVGNNSGNSVSVYQPAAGGGFAEAAGSPLVSDALGDTFGAPGAMLYASVPAYGGFLAIGFGPGSSTNAVDLYATPLTAASVPLYQLTNASCHDPSGPTAIALSVVNNVPQLYIADYYNEDIAVYGVGSFAVGATCPTPVLTIANTPAGSFNPQGIDAPEGLAVDGYGNIFVSNSASTANTLTVYGPTGALVYTQH